MMNSLMTTTFKNPIDEIRTRMERLPGYSILGDFPFWNLLEDTTETKYPPCNVLETADGFLIEVAVPGWTRDMLEVSLKDNVLRIEGQKKEVIDERIEKYRHKGISGKAFIKSFTIANDLLVEEVFLENGLLNISLLRNEQEEPDRLVFDIEEE